MAGGWNSGSDREAMLRRVAIVLSSLPGPTASKLLGSIDPESKQALRRTMSTLSDVDPLERQRAIQAFKVMFQSQPTRVPMTESDSDSLQIQNSSPNTNVAPSSRVVPTVVVSNEAKQEPRSPLAFLGAVEDRSLARLLTVEHPQTIAFVLASIAPEQAARVLPQLGAKVQHETMSRIGRLGDIPETAIAEVAEHFRGRLKEQTPTNRHSLGRQALEAILAAMPKQGVTPQSTASESQIEAQSTVNGNRGQRIGEPSLGEVDRQSAQYSTSGLPVEDLTRRLRIAEQTWPEQLSASESDARSPSGAEAHAVVRGQSLHGDRTQRDNRQRDTRQHDADAGLGRQKATNDSTATPRFDSTDGIHRHLIGLSPTELCQALGKVDTRDAMLALCGLPVPVADAALAMLPRSQAKAVRFKMNSLGSLNLREIDRAKEKVAEASLHMLPSPSLRTPLAA